MKKAQKNILLIDDHPITRQGVSALINQTDHLRVCGEADSAAQAMELIPKLQPDLVILDISLKTMNGIELMKNLKVQFPKLPVLMMSMHDEGLYAQRSLRAGALGYIMKQEANAEVLNAVNKVLNGELYLSEKIKEKMVYNLIDQKSKKAAFSIEQLTDRELEVFHLIGQCVSTRDIAKKLHLSVKTVEAHKEKIKNKLNLTSGAELLRHAIVTALEETGC
jgi:DNA-binding NarL/FixJ family response regulator